MKELIMMAQLLVWFLVIAYVAPVGTFFGLIGMLMTLPLWVNIIYILSFIPLIVYSPKLMKWLHMENI